MVYAVHTTCVVNNRGTQPDGQSGPP
jgi:hypothetical protein